MLIMLAFCSTFVGCTTVESTAKVSTKLTAMQFNRVASAYLERETSTEVLKTNDGATMLHVTFALYGQGRGGAIFVKGNMQQYAAHIEKFLEWARLAEVRNEALTKEIGRAPTWVPGSSGTLRFTFHSASTRTHVLQITTCTIICIDETALVLNIAGARELQRLLIDFDEGRLRVVDASAYR